jgi:hypothetical protein
MPTSYSSVGGYLPTPPSSGGGSGGGGQVTPPANKTQTFSQIQTLTNWVQPGNVGDSGGGSGKHQRHVHPDSREPCNVLRQRRVSVQQRLLVHHSRKVLDWANKWTFHLEIQFPTLYDFTSSQAIEFELQQDVGGYIFNMAWQANFVGASKTWKTFDYTNKVFESTGIPVNFSLFNTQQYCRMEAVYTRTANTTTHVSLKVNDILYQINKTRPAFARVLSPHTNAAFQLDSNHVPLPYIVHARNFNVIAEQATF